MTTAVRERARTIATRRRTAADEAFLRGLFDSTREPEFAVLGWPPEQLAALLSMQFAAHERSLPADAEDRVVEVDGRPAGRLIVDASGLGLRLLDIALLPGLRNFGIGDHLLGQLCARADAQGRAITLSVLRGSPAIRLYLRRGFTCSEPGDLHDQMLRAPGATR